ncbi:MAG: leader peptidase (prepilin peptidase)/N-methyltransferase [Oceanicoccus sp.]|jgi:leader peptidase (prepilin peptidase)/N-methyltransferase
MFHVFIQNPVLFYSCVFVFSLCIGSFLNVVAYRLPVMMRRQAKADYFEITEQEAEYEKLTNEPAFNLMLPHSSCPKCKATIKPWQNIPIISYLWLRGQCANCKVAISARYPVVEAATGLFGLLIALQFGVTLQTIILLLVSYFLVVLTLIDLDEYLLPDSLTLPLIWIGLIANSFNVFTSLESAVYGAVAGYLSLWSIFWLFKLVTGKEGMGYGDFKLLAAIGALLGWQALPMVILLSSAVGAVVGIAMIVILGRDKNIPIPFGPYLAAAGFIAALWGHDITQLYFSFMGIK